MGYLNSHSTLSQFNPLSTKARIIFCNTLPSCWRQNCRMALRRLLPQFWRVPAGVKAISLRVISDSHSAEVCEIICFKCYCHKISSSLSATGCQEFCSRKEPGRRMSGLGHMGHATCASGKLAEGGRSLAHSANSVAKPLGHLRVTLVGQLPESWDKDCLSVPQRALLWITDPWVLRTCGLTE